MLALPEEIKDDRKKKRGIEDSSLYRYFMYTLRGDIW